MIFLFKLKDKILGEDKTSPSINNLSGDELIDYCLKNDLIREETSDGLTEKDIESIQKRIWKW
tara:strand:- start:268 stop:456 length:189 start_codon:yes stop_codon:yes gene_type:complete